MIFGQAKWEKPKDGEEHRIQEQFTRWLRGLDHPAARAAYAIPNNAVSARKWLLFFVSEGLKPGVPDYCIPYPSRGYGALYIEFKTPIGEVSGVQTRMHEILREAGNFIYVARSLREAQQVFCDYLKE